MSGLNQKVPKKWRYWNAQSQSNRRTRSHSKCQIDKPQAVIEEKQFCESKHTSEKDIDGVQSVLVAGFLDLVSQGDGFAMQVIRNDESLKKAIAFECKKF